jgi:ferredoxin
MPRLSWDAAKCQASGECSVVAPHLLELDDDLVLRFEAEQPAEELETLRQACLRCPTGALQLDEG